MKQLFALTFAVALVSGVPAFAFDDKAKGGEKPSYGSIAETAAWFFDKQDTNKDGFVTPDERSALKSFGKQTAFSKLDLDKDGKLTKDEYIEAFTKLHQAMGDREA